MSKVRAGQLRTAWHILDTPSVTPAIIQHYAPKGKWPAWRDYNDKAVGRPTYIKTGRTLAERLTQYTRLCRQHKRMIQIERTHEGTKLLHGNSWAHFIESPDEELTTLRKYHKQALGYWEQLAQELREPVILLKVV